MQIKNTWLEKIFGILKDSPKTKTDLLEILKTAVHDGLIDNESLKMIEGVFKVSEVQVRDIMIPRPHMTVIDITDQIDEIVKKGKITDELEQKLNSTIDNFKTGFKAA